MLAGKELHSTVKSRPKAGTQPVSNKVPWSDRWKSASTARYAASGEHPGDNW